ncbi:MAG TPA: DUF429 domain-containing protein [Alphaproteobacteria bacterium]
MRPAPPRIWLGIDFSGNHLQWRATDGARAVWIATVIEERRAGPRVTDVRRVQELPGAAAPFARLAQFLRDAPFAVAGIDAPFAPPAAHHPFATRAELIERIMALRCDPRPFPTGAALVGLLAPALAPRGRHVFRATERLWRARGLNVRSVTWNGPRGGAPFTAACLRLQGACARPAWPWAPRDTGRLLAEVFPAAQLKTWNLPSDRYNGAAASARERRATIVAGLAARVQLPDAIAALLLASADALDSVVCALAARAVSEDTLRDEPGPEAAREGWMAVHR